MAGVCVCVMHLNKGGGGWMHGRCVLFLQVSEECILC